MRKALSMGRSRHQARRAPSNAPARVGRRSCGHLRELVRDGLADGRAVATGGSAEVDGACVALQMTFLNSSASVPVIRALVRKVADAWGYERELIDDAELVAAELTANAVLHGRPRGCDRLDVRLKPGQKRLRIEVADCGSSLPNQKVAGSASETGRGLLLVEAVCRRWGVVREIPKGKTVWAELVADAEGAGQSQLPITSRAGRRMSEASNQTPSESAPWQ